MDSTLTFNLKRKLARAVVSRLFSSGSPRNLKVISRIFSYLAITRASRERARKIQWLFKTEHPFLNWFQRIGRGNPNVRNRWISNVYVDQFFLSKAKREKFKNENGFYPPDFIVISPLGRCNLSCKGCWGGEYDDSDELSLETLERIIGEARDVFGNHWITFTGGEPFLRKDLLQIYKKFSDVQFCVFTNGSVLANNPDVADQLAQLGNVSPMFSLEGWEETTDRRRGTGMWATIMKGMRNMRERRIVFGFACTVTRENVEELYSEPFVDYLMQMGALYGWYFQYIPLGDKPDLSMMVTPRQRDYMRRKIYEIRNRRPILLVDFQNDGPEVGGCLAGGHTYLHISPQGDVEPCVFVHLADSNIHRHGSMTAALKRPFLTAIREAIPYDGNEIRPCMITDRPEVLRHHYQACKKHKDGVYPTHRGADFYITDPGAKKALDQYSSEYKKLADDAWIKGEWERILPDPPEVARLRKEEAACLPDRQARQKYPWQRTALPINQAVSGRLYKEKTGLRAGHSYKEEHAIEEGEGAKPERIPPRFQLYEVK